MRLTQIAPKTIAASAALLLAAGVLSACSSDDSDASGTSTSRSSDAKPAGALTQDTFATTIASAMQKSGSAHVTMSGTIAGQELKAEGDQNIGETAADSQVALKMQILGQNFELRLLDQVVYFNLGQMSQNKFAEIDLTDTSDPLVSQFGSLATQADVSAQFESFEGAITQFDKAGATEKIDGVDAQPYTVTVDAKKLAKASGQKAVAGMPATLDYTFYVGPDDLPRRMVAGATGQEITLDFTQWGEKVTIEKPSADQITDVDLSQLGAGATGGA